MHLLSILILEPVAVCQQPPMGVPLSHQIVMPDGAPFEGHVANPHVLGIALPLPDLNALPPESARIH